jgi:hypothetical protein
MTTIVIGRSPDNNGRWTIRVRTSPKIVADCSGLLSLTSVTVSKVNASARPGLLYAGGLLRQNPENRPPGLGSASLGRFRLLKSAPLPHLSLPLPCHPSGKSKALQ